MPEKCSVTNIVKSFGLTPMSKGQPALRSRASKIISLGGGAGSPPHVSIRGLTQRFGEALIYNKFDLDISRGKLISVFGPNGCGKNTLINMIAGLIPVDAGEILFDGMFIALDGQNRDPAGGGEAVRCEAGF